MACSPFSKSSRSLLIYIIFLALIPLGCERHNSPTTSYKVAAKGLHSAAIDDKGEYIVIGSIHHGGSLWKHDTQERLFNWNHSQNEQSTISAADFSSDGQWALTAETHTLVLWNVTTGTAERYWTAPGEVLDLELGPNARNALLGLDDHSAVIFDIRRGGILRTFSHQNRVRSVDQDRDGRIALTGSEDYSANLWDINASKKLTALKHADDVQLVKLSSDGSIALSVSKYDKALLWETQTGEAIGEIPLRKQHLKRGIRFTAAQFSDDNALLLTGRPDQVVELWDIATLTRLDSWKLPKTDAWKPTSAAVLAVAFTSKTSFVAVASNGFVHELKYK